MDGRVFGGCRESLLVERAIVSRLGMADARSRLLVLTIPSPLCDIEI
jgi:hypothetical protein